MRTLAKPNKFSKAAQLRLLDYMARLNNVFKFCITSTLKAAENNGKAASSIKKTRKLKLFRQAKYKFMIKSKSQADFIIIKALYALSAHAGKIRQK